MLRLAYTLLLRLMLPVAAAPAGQAMNKSVLDPRLKNDLWNAQEQHRLTIFDANVAHATTLFRGGIEVGVLVVIVVACLGAAAGSDGLRKVQAH